MSRVAVIALFLLTSLCVCTVEAQASIVWKWSWKGEAGQFVTDGALAEGSAPAGTYSILDFSVTNTALGASGAVVGSISGGEYDEGSQPGQGFFWDGRAVTQWFRDGGVLTNGANLYVSGSGDTRYLFEIGLYLFREFSGGDADVSSTVDMTPLKEPTETICWNWSWNGEMGQITTDGLLIGGTAPAGTYRILDFSVTDTALGGSGAVVGSIAGGEYDEASQPGQGFVWDGNAVTQWFRDGGVLTNGANFYATAIGGGRYVFAIGFYAFRNSDDDDVDDSSTIDFGTKDLELPASAGQVSWGQLKSQY